VSVTPNATWPHLGPVRARKLFGFVRPRPRKLLAFSLAFSKSRNGSDAITIACAYSGMASAYLHLLFLINATSNTLNSASPARGTKGGPFHVIKQSQVSPVC